MPDNDQSQIVLGVYKTPFLAVMRYSDTPDAIIELHKEISNPDTVTPAKMEDFVEWMEDHGTIVFFSTRDELVGLVQGLLATDRHMEAIGQTLPPVEQDGVELETTEVEGNA